MKTALAIVVLMIGQTQKTQGKDPAAPLLTDLQLLADYHETVVRRAVSTAGNDLAKKRILDAHAKECATLERRKITWKMDIDKINEQGEVTVIKLRLGKNGSAVVAVLTPGGLEIDKDVDVEKLKTRQTVVIRAEIAAVDLDNHVVLAITLSHAKMSLR